MGAFRYGRVLATLCGRVYQSSASSVGAFSGLLVELWARLYLVWARLVSLWARLSGSALEP